MPALTWRPLRVYNSVMTTMPKSVESRARRFAGGFTLTELLTVVAIMGILMAMLTPALSRAITQARRRACASNVRSIIGGAVLYARSDSKMRLPAVKPKSGSKYPGPETGNWGDMVKGNPGCLARLIDSKYCQRELFLCQEAKSSRNFKMMEMDGEAFTYDTSTGVSTLSYSFISMVYNAQWKTSADPEGNLAAMMTMDKVPGTLPVLADQNPRCTFGEQTLKDYENLKNSNGDPLSKKLRRNSPNHRHVGQNVGRWDQSVKWITDANNPNFPEDDIYMSASSQESLGRRKEMDDAFLIP